MSSDPTGKLAPWKWALGALALITVIAASIALGWWISPHHDTPDLSGTGGPSVVMAVVLFIIGFVFALLGVAVYGLVLLTNNFTMDFSRPFFSTFGGKLWFGNLLVGLLVQGGLAFMISPVLIRLLWGVLPQNLLIPVSFFGPFIVLQFVMVWLAMWAPLETIVIRKRLTAMGVTGEQLASGIPIGISDPAHSSLKKLTLVEEDLGMLWLAPDRMIYRGDRQQFDITRRQLISIGRKADAGSTSSYFGASHVILTFMQDDGTQRSVRLHPEGDWTMTRKARALNRLAERIEAWHSGPVAAVSS